MLRVSSVIDRLSDGIGRIAELAIIPVVILAAAVVVLRYVFGIGFPWMQESFVWLHSTAFMLAAGYVLKQDGHVRVDLFYRRASRRRHAVVEILGTLFLLLPTVGVIFWMSLPIVERSWRMGEISPNPDGLPYLYLLKTVVLLFCLLLGLQGLSQAIKAVAVLTGRDQGAGS